MSKTAAPLEDLRRRIDAIDDQIHDLLMQRAEVVEAIGDSKRSVNGSILRPGREARILRRLVARHRGRFPRPVLVRLWRELLSGTVAIQTDFLVAVHAPEDASGCWDLARDHYGSHTPMAAYRSLGEVLRVVTEERAGAGVLPMPEQGERDAWWRVLAAGGADGPRVIARLPFAGRGNARKEGGDALVISRSAPEPSGEDRSLIVVETDGEVSRARLIAAFSAVGLEVTHIVTVEAGPSVAAHLVEIDDLAVPDDRRLASAIEPLGDKVMRVSSLGFYARPFAPAALEGTSGGAS
jgi:chorismate mutase-like protein